VAAAKVTDSWVGGPVRVPDYPEPVTGFRAWSIGEVDGLAYLTSLTHLSVPWPTDGPIVAEHVGIPRYGAGADPGEPARILQRADDTKYNLFHLREKPPVPPVEGCVCGVYARKTADALEEAWYFSALPGKTKVVGEVRLWGKMWEHELGWRAQFARPAALYYVKWGGHPRELVEAMAARYAVSVVDASDVLRKTLWPS
jgi:hypothetical protein